MNTTHSTAIKPHPAPPVSAQTQRHWYANNPVATHLANGVNMLFPAGERFFVRSVNAFIDELDDAALRADVRGFFQQEGKHAKAHDQFNQVLRDQGYEIDSFLKRHDRWMYGWFEPKMSPKLRLATTAAAEHFTALMAEGALGHDTLATADPEMKALLMWHAAEEIEHKAVAFDVLRAVDDSYALRVAGLAVATTTLAIAWFSGTRHLLRQEGIGARAAWRSLQTLPRRRRILRDVFGAGIRSYLRRDFHPNQHDNAFLARAYFAAASGEATLSA